MLKNASTKNTKEFALIARLIKETLYISDQLQNSTTECNKISMTLD